MTVFPGSFELYGPSADERKKFSRTHDHLLTNFQCHFGDIELSSITSEKIFTLLIELSKGTEPSTMRLRFTVLSIFLTISETTLSPGAETLSKTNLCDHILLRNVRQANIRKKDVYDDHL